MRAWRGTLIAIEAVREVAMLLFVLAAIMGGLSFVYVKKRRQRKASS
jgi:hypothetical protein